MKINLNEQELHNAIAQYIESEGIGLNNKHIDIQITAGRSPKGFYADVEILDSVPTTSEDDSPFAADANIGTAENQPALDLDTD